MSTLTLQKLNNDHKNIARVLYCLSRQIEDFEDPDMDPSIAQIMDIIDYISTVPERWHHPVEDVMFKRMIERCPDRAAEIQAVIDEHEDLEQLTYELKTDFERIALDIAVPIRRLYESIRTYLSRQMRHLDTEETVLFPLAEECLDDDDWVDIEELAAVILESLDDRAQQEYEHLHESIVHFYKE